MAIRFIKGDLLNSHCQYICHQVNCCGVMGSGIAKQIKEKWPIVYEEYKTRFNGTKSPIGTIQIVKAEDKSIINIFAQEGYGYDGKRYTSYDAFWMCLGQIKDNVPKGAEIAFPNKIGSDRGGANWRVIYSMIEEVLGEDYEVFIYKLEG